MWNKLWNERVLWKYIHPCRLGHPIIEIRLLQYGRSIDDFRVRKLSLSKRGAKCKTFLVKMSSICMRMLHENFHINGLALSLALKLRLRAIRKWPGQKVYHHSYFNSYAEPFIFHPWTWSWFLYLFVCIFFPSKPRSQVWINYIETGF